MLNRNIFNILVPIFALFILSGCSMNQLNKVFEPKEFVYKREDISVELLNRVNQIVEAMSKNDIAMINEKFVHPKFGVYNFYKQKGEKIFVHQKLIYNIISDETEQFSHLISRIDKTYKQLPVLIENVNFNCSPNSDEFYGWDKEGIFIDSKIKPLLSNYMKETNLKQKDRFKKDDFHKAKLIEKTGYRVVLTPEVVFDMIKIDKKWYMVLIDRATTDCSSIKRKG